MSHYTFWLKKNYVLETGLCLFYPVHDLHFSDVIRVQSSTVVSQKSGTFICELLMERYVYLRNTQKQQKITNYVRNKSFLEFYLVYNGVCLKLLGLLLL